MPLCFANGFSRKFDILSRTYPISWTSFKMQTSTREFILDEYIVYRQANILYYDNIGVEEKILVRKANNNPQLIPQIFGSHPSAFSHFLKSKNVNPPLFG